MVELQRAVSAAECRRSSLETGGHQVATTPPTSTAAGVVASTTSPTSGEEGNGISQKPVMSFKLLIIKIIYQLILILK